MSTFRRPTPRPTYAEPTVIRRQDTAHHVWGDAGAGLVTDRVYSSSLNLHVLEFELPAGAGFTHSETNKTVFAGDVAYCVLDGELVLANPLVGEVRRVRAGQGVLFRRDTWHHGFNPTGGTTRVLEFFSPPPSRGTASEYARQQPMIPEVSYADRRWLGRWPAARDESERAVSLHVLDDDRALWGFAATAPTHLTATWVSTEFLTVVHGTVFPGNIEDFRPCVDETSIVCTAGELWVDMRLADDTFAPACLSPGDGVVLPAGTPWRALVRASHPAEYLLGEGRVPEGWVPGPPPAPATMGG
ncbi:cupin domain-containing protein [Oryzobacter telluris]|uniref:cupin domain-containing protein n=1 Tax=Oryzobacter telluris TaxID=3149179 RepID=UPI00370DB29E